jgi:hypothetical protein
MGRGRGVHQHEATIKHVGYGPAFGQQSLGAGQSLLSWQSCPTAHEVWQLAPVALLQQTSPALQSSGPSHSNSGPAHMFPMTHMDAWSRRQHARACGQTDVSHATP